MNLLLLSQYFWPENFGINEFIKSCVQRGVTVDVLTAKPNYPGGKVFGGYRATGCSREQWSGASVSRVPIIPRGRGGGIRLAANYLSFIFSASFFGPWLLRGRSTDVIFVYAPSPLLQVLPALFLGWLKHCPVVLWVQDLWPESLEATGHVRNRLLLRMVEFWVRLIYRHSDVILVQSEAFIARIAQFAPSKKIVYFPNSVSGAFLRSSPQVPNSTPPVVGKTAFSVLFAGNIGTAQAMEVVVEAAEMLKPYSDIQFVIVGRGSRKEWLAQQVRERGLTNLHLAGHLPMEAMPDTMAQASALLVTLADQPIFALTVPSKLQAYMAAGRPIVACLNGEGARLVSEARAGLAVPAGDAGGLAEAVLQLYRMPMEERQQFGENGRRYFRSHFEHEKLVDDLIHYLEDAVSSRTGKQ